ncbi:MAG: DNA polymerase II [Nanobdellota archaeon]
MKGYIVYGTYRVIDDKPIVYIFGRLENDESFLAKIPFRPYFFIKKSDIKNSKKVLELDYEECSLTDFAGESVVKIFAPKPSDVPSIRKTYEDAGIVTYEADIRFIQRFYMDYGLLGSVEIDGEYTRTEKISRVYENPEISSLEDYEPELKVLSIDIETDMDIKNVYSIALYSGDVSEVHMICDKKIDNVYSYADEKSLLEGLKKRVNKIDPDLVTGWNVVDFDLKVLKGRFEAHGIPFNLGRTSENCRLTIQNNFMRESKADFMGRIVFDGISLVQQSYMDFDDFKLDTVSKEVLNESKIELEKDFWMNFKEIIKKEPERVAKYNLKDAKLVYEILSKKRLVELAVKRSLITGMQLDRIKASIASLDSLYIRRAHDAGYVCPNSVFSEREERVKGAYVMNPKPGIYENIVVLDFKSLYPSVIRTFNIDPIAFDHGGEIVAPNGASFENNEGILPSIIKVLGKEREKAKNEKDETKSFAIKIIMNSFYGVLANPTCRFYSLDMANAITSFARDIIKQTIFLVEKYGYKVLYGDTDSVFVDVKSSEPNSADKAGVNIANKINKYFDKKVLDEYNRESILELEFEKRFKVLILPGLRKSSAGAKKRYAGLLVKDGKEEISVTGLELVRRDWTEIAKKVQMELLERVFYKKGISDYLRDVVSQIKEGKFDDLLVYKKSISKDLEEYTKTTPPHVKAARQLDSLTSNIVSYYMTVNGPEPVEKLKSSIDYNHYIEKQIKPIAETILHLFDMNFDDVIKNSNQKSLFDY